MALWCLCYRHRASGASLEHCWSHFRFHNSLLTIKSICWCRHDEAKLGHVSFLAKIRSEKLTLLLWLNWKLEYIVTSPWFGTWIWFISGIVILSVLLAHNFIYFFFLLFNERKSQGRLAFIFGAEDGKASLLSKKRCSYELGLVGLHLIVAVMEEHSFMVQGFRKREQALWICANWVLSLFPTAVSWIKGFF